MKDPQSTHLQARLEHFLERLGRTVESPRDKQVVARHRTALVEEQTKFKVVDLSKEQPLKTAINIYGGTLALPDETDYPQSFYFDDFLDQTVQAQRIATDVLQDKELARLRNDFIPQKVAVEGDTLPTDSVSYFFDDWMASDSQLLAVLAPAGYGKTVLTCELAARMAARYLASDPGRLEPFPFLIPFGQFRRLASFEGMILSSLQKKGVTDYTAGAFAYLVQQNRAVMILDGFDELLEERPEEAQKNLRELVETLEGRGKVVITARSTFFRSSEEVANILEYSLQPDQVTVVELLQFDQDQRQAYIEHHFESQRERERALTFVNSKELSEVMGSPLLLRETVDVLAHSDEDTPLDPHGDRADLFGVLETNVYKRERERHGHHFSDDTQGRFLRGLGREMLAGNARGFDWDLIQVLASESVPDSEPATDADFARLADHHFLTVREAAGEVQFNHQVFREYFQSGAVLDACRDGALEWLVAMLSRRPLPEAVRGFLAETDREVRLPVALLDDGVLGARPSDRFVNNLGALFGAYGEPRLIAQLLEKTPKEVPLGFSLFGLDLSGFDWSKRFIQGMEFVSCSLDTANFRHAYVGEMTIREPRVGGADFRDARIDALGLDHGERLFGRLACLEALQRLGAVSGLEAPAVKRDLEQERREQIISIVRGRIKRFYVAGASDRKDSRWDDSIQERNLLGGVRPKDAKFVRSKVIPRMLSLGILAKNREHGIVVYHLANDAEDDARALLEGGNVIGVMAELVEWLASKAGAAA